MSRRTEYRTLATDSASTVAIDCKNLDTHGAGILANRLVGSAAVFAIEVSQDNGSYLSATDWNASNMSGLASGAFVLKGKWRYVRLRITTTEVAGFIQVWLTGDEI